MLYNFVFYLSHDSRVSCTRGVADHIRGFAIMRCIDLLLTVDTCLSVNTGHINSKSCGGIFKMGFFKEQIVDGAWHNEN